MGWNGDGISVPCLLCGSQVPGMVLPFLPGHPAPCFGPPPPWLHWALAPGLRPGSVPSPSQARALTATLPGSPWGGHSLCPSAELLPPGGTAGRCLPPPCRQHKLEENLLFSGKFTDALQALMDWLYRAEPQLSEEAPVGGDRDLVSDLMDKHKVGFPPRHGPGLSTSPDHPPPLCRRGLCPQEQPPLYRILHPQGCWGTLPAPLLQRAWGVGGPCTAMGARQGAGTPPSAFPTPSCPLSRSSRRSWASEPAASRC